MYEYYLQKDDLLPAIRVKIRDADDYTNFDLTGYTATFTMSPVTAMDTPKISAAVVNITNATAGEAEYRWGGTDSDTVGKYYWQMTFTRTADSKSFTIPKKVRGVVHIEARLG